MYTLSNSIILPTTLETAWTFFSNPANLSSITPPELNLIPTSPLPETMYPGLIITYEVKPFPLFKQAWVTEITTVEEGKLFVDEQRFGPYRFWHHEHHFTSHANGIQCDDIIHYMLPFDPFSRFFHPLFVKQRLNSIFSFRKEALKGIFGADSNLMHNMSGKQ